MNPEMPPLAQPKAPEVEPNIEQSDPASFDSNFQTKETPLAEKSEPKAPLLSSSMDFYERLGISANASAEEIKKAYRRSSMTYHPDKNLEDKSTEESFKLVGEAYETLSDVSKRLKYDQGRSSSGFEFQVTREGGTEALTRLREAWRTFGIFQPNQEYYERLAQESPNYIDTETKVVEIFPNIDKAWGLFRSESGLNISVSSDHYVYLVNSHSTLWATWEIEKINLLRQLNSAMLEKKSISDGERRERLSYFLNNWNSPDASQHSIKSAIKSIA